MMTVATEASGSAELRPRAVSLELVGRVARDGLRIKLADGISEQMSASAAAVAGFDAGEEPAYGVTTGFGSLARVTIPPERRAELQRALVRSHAAGVGEPIEGGGRWALEVFLARSRAY